MSSETPPPRGTGVPIRGHVRDGAQAPVPGAVLTLVDGVGRQVGRADADGGGAYELFAPEPGNYVLIASARTHQPQAGTASVGREPVRLDITMVGASSLRGHVRSSTGVVVAGAVVTLADARGEVRESFVTAAGGDYLLTALEPGMYTLAVTAVGHRPVALAVVISAGQDSREDVELATSASIRGTVALEGGLPPGIGVKLTLLDGEGDVVRVTTADAEGHYVFYDLDPGSYTVVATSYAPVTQRLQVAEGEQTRHDVRLA